MSLYGRIAREIIRRLQESIEILGRQLAAVIGDLIGDQVEPTAPDRYEVITAAVGKPALAARHRRQKADTEFVLRVRFETVRLNADHTAEIVAHVRCHSAGYEFGLTDDAWIDDAQRSIQRSHVIRIDDLHTIDTNTRLTDMATAQIERRLEIVGGHAGQFMQGTERIVGEMWHQFDFLGTEKLPGAPIAVKQPMMTCDHGDLVDRGACGPAHFSNVRFDACLCRPSANHEMASVAAGAQLQTERRQHFAKGCQWLARPRQYRDSHVRSDQAG